MHLQSICDEFNNDNHTMNAEDRIHYAAELVKAATNVSKAVAKDIDITPYVLQVLEIGALFAKEIDEEEPQDQEPNQEVFSFLQHQYDGHNECCASWRSCH